MIIEKLIQRRNDIALKVRELNKSLVHIDATIKLFQADLVVEKLENQRGAISRELFEIMRNAPRPLTTRELAIKMFGADCPELDLQVKNLGVTLLYHEKRGLVRSDSKIAGAKLWEINISANQ
jgi:hypothetical protein